MFVNTNEPKTNACNAIQVDDKIGYSQKLRFLLMSFAPQMTYRMSECPQKCKHFVSIRASDNRFRHYWLSYKERRVDALALRADERRDKLR